MKAAILADVHGNAAALDAVLDDVASVNPDRILLNGDLLAFGPEPAETVALLRRLDAPSTRGNTDRWLAEAARGKRAVNVTDQLYESLRWTAARLDPGDLDPFTDLPFALALDPLAALLYHASGAGDEEGVWPNTPEPEVPALFPDAPVTTFVVSHTHLPGERLADGVRVLNTGSVGLPYDEDTRACYLVLEGEPNDVRASWRRVAYDRARTIQAYRERGVPMAARMIQRVQTGMF